MLITLKFGVWELKARNPRPPNGDLPSPKLPLYIKVMHARACKAGPAIAKTPALRSLAPAPFEGWQAGPSTSTFNLP